MGYNVSKKQYFHKKTFELYDLFIILCDIVVFVEFPQHFANVSETRK